MSTNIIIGSGLQVNKTATFSSDVIAQQFICSPVSQCAGIHVYGDTSYSSEIAFYNGTVETGTKIWEVGGTTANVTSSGNFFFIYSNIDSTNALTIETGSPMTINLLGKVYTPNTLTASNAIINNTLTANTATISTTLTANSIVATSASISDTLTVNTATVTTTLSSPNIVATSIQLNVTGSNPQGLSIIGVTGTSASDTATQIFFQSNASGVLTTHWQLGPNFATADPLDFWLYNNIGRYNVLQIHASIPQIDIISSVNITGSVTLTETLTANSIVATSASISDTLTVNTATVTTTLTASDITINNTLTVNTATITTTLTANDIVATSSISIQTLPTYSASLGDDASGTVTLSYLNLTSVVVLFISNVPTWSAGTYQSISITNPPNLPSYPLYNLIALQVETTTSTSFQFVNAFSSGSLTVISYTNVPSGSTLTLNPFSITYQVESSPA